LAGDRPDRFFSLTNASVSLDNASTCGRRNSEAACHGVHRRKRTVEASFTMFEQDNAATKGLYQAARQQSPIEVMFQLGQQSGQLFGRANEKA